MPGGNKDGICDPGEPCRRAAELGYDDAGNPVYFNTYDFDARLGVVHQPLGTGAGEGPTPAFTWSIRAHFGDDADGDHLIDYTTTAAQVQDEHRTVDFNAGTTVGPSPPVSYSWAFDDGGSRFGSGRLTHVRDAERPRREPHGRRRRGASTTLTKKITIRDIVIVSLGDSIASGEGNPDNPLPISASPAGRCGRTSAATAPRSPARHRPRRRWRTPIRTRP